MEELIGALSSCDKSRNRLLQPTEDDREDKASARLAAASVINKETVLSFDILKKRTHSGSSVEKSFLFTPH